jgi:hypothetical protein
VPAEKVARRFLPLLVLCLFGLVVFAASWAVGASASRHEGFDWELASIFGTALGTTLLALATSTLAYSTRSEVRATKELAELTARDQENRERPLVLLTGTRIELLEQEGRAGVVAILLRNVGLGPALRVRVQVTYMGHEDWQPNIPSLVVTYIEPNGLVEPQARFSGPEPAPGGGVRNEFEVSGTYWDRTLKNEQRILTDWLG